MPQPPRNPSLDPAGKQDENGVSDMDVMLFKQSALGRHFPGLRKMSDADIRRIVAADKQAEQRRAADPRAHRTFPKTEGLPPPPRLQPHLSVPFVPTSPAKGKEEASRRNGERFLGPAPLPFEDDRARFNTDRATDRSKALAQQPFIPCGSRAQVNDMVAADVGYLYGLKSAERKAEREATTMRGVASKASLAQALRSRRGQTLLPCRIEDNRKSFASAMYP